MQQLLLFEDSLSRSADHAAERDAADGAQLDLFADRSLVLLRARDALASLDAEAARSVLRDARTRYPRDAPLAAEIERLDALARRVESALRAPRGARAERLLEMAESIAPVRGPCGAPQKSEPVTLDDKVRSCALSWAAREAIACSGDAILIRGVAPGFLLLLAGDREGAAASLQRAMQRTRRAHFAALLGELARRSGDRRLAGQLYLSALRGDPYDVDFDTIGDEDVRSLPGVARYAFDIGDEPIAWAAAVAVVTRVLELPALFGGADAVGAPAPRAELSASQASALDRSNAFLDAFGRARRRATVGEAGVLEARRAMKRLQPALFEAVMGRGAR